MTASNDPTEAARLCPNCYAQLAPAARYCAHCGQQARQHVPTLIEFVHEFVSHYVALEGVLWRTLGALLFKPGKLAREYFAGRRGRWVSPLRLYLTASILFFVAIRLTSNAPGVIEAEAQADIQGGFSVNLGDDWGMFDALRIKLTKRIGQVNHQLTQGNAGEQLLAMLRRFVQSLYYAMFLLLPIYAAITALVYLNRRMTFGQHMVYALYSHAFLFFMLLVLFVNPWPTLFGVVALWLLTYPLIELRRVYGGRRWTTFLRATLIGVLYFLVSMPVVMLFFLLAVIG